MVCKGVPRKDQQLESSWKAVLWVDGWMRMDDEVGAAEYPLLSADFKVEELISVKGASERLRWAMDGTVVVGMSKFTRQPAELDANPVLPNHRLGFLVR